ncbi:FAD-dependent monooxygenase [Saccharopolyspora sp. K220]|uniref:FAD-dependent monooxygenase n=1 Tax=Saccharopolyspora soli TaxID=2926618 RepID=UPI001F56B8D6|nr:FAD-dependent monooxygenase [Saccharopolyspora soli]MCI2418049.1 FAD-dependent monooxygenase [Saccharopolyspora soli]
MSSNRAVDRQDVVVVGGGIGGLAAALALRLQGQSVRLLERAAEFGEVGAGLQLAPNATRILREWGVLDQVLAAGVEPHRLVLRDAVSGDELTHLDLDDEFRTRFGAPYVVVHRSDLHRILVDACRDAGVLLETNCHVERVESTDDTAFTYCAGGRVLESHVALGVDGLNSTLRDGIVGDQPVASGYVAYRGAVAVEEMPAEVNLDEVVAWIGPTCHLVQYALRQRQMVNQVAVFRSPAFDRGESDWGGPEELDDAFRNCCEPVRNGLASLWRDRRWQMHDREPVDNWISGRLLLLGDAAHPVLQYLAQGACQALEDAATIAREASEHNNDWPTALQATQQARIPRTARVQRNARTWGDIWHIDGVGRLLRNELLTNRDPHDYTHIDWLYTARETE